MKIIQTFRTWMWFRRNPECPRDYCESCGCLAPSYGTCSDKRIIRKTIPPHCGNALIVCRDCFEGLTLVFGWKRL